LALWALSLAALPLMLGAGRARAAGADSLRSVPAPPQKWSDQPRFVMMRSLLVPGWGQFYNHAYIKGVAVAGTEVWILSAISTANRDLDRLQQQSDAALASGDAAAYSAAQTAYNDKLSHFVSLQWLMGGVVAYALLDAYVDAHFRHFAVEFRKDSVPPGGPAPSQVRLDLRWNF
jgi:hypothetical protein